MRRARRALVTCVVLAAATAAVAAATETTALAGPALIVPGHQARFVATGFRPGSDLQVVLEPADKRNCCAIRVPASFRVAGAGTAVIRFSVPLYYKRCGAWTCTRVSWRRHEKVVVTVSGYLLQARTTTAIG
jgi:hypothetical protein